MDLSAYDYIDLGCSSGGSLKYGRDVLGGTSGLGIDIDPAKVEKTRQAGFDAEVMDATTLAGQPNCVSFITMIHFLEHLPNLQLVENCIRASIIASKDFVLFRQPWFDSDAELERVDCKFFWSDWRGHTCHLSTGDIARILVQHARDTEWAIYGYKTVNDTSDATIIPLSCDSNRHHYKPDIDPPKQTYLLEPQAFHEALTIVNISGKYSTLKLVEKHKDSRLLMSSP